MAAGISDDQNVYQIDCPRLCGLRLKRGSSVPRSRCIRRGEPERSIDVGILRLMHEIDIWYIKEMIQ